MSLIHALHEDTLIEVNGILTPIKDIQIGDVVKSYNTDSQVIGESKVVSKHIGFDSEYYHIILSDGSQLKTSIKSLFYSQDGEWLNPLDVYHLKKSLLNGLEITSLRDGGNSNYPRRTGQIAGPGTEKSDSIPAMLSDGEFVMTAAAVRGMGKGSRREGAKRMYALMHQLERNAARG